MAQKLLSLLATTVGLVRGYSEHGVGEETKTPAMSLAQTYTEALSKTHTITEAEYTPPNWSWVHESRNKCLDVN